MLACQQGLEHDVKNLIIRKVRKALTRVAKMGDCFIWAVF
jgi:hypothetical protein